MPLNDCQATEISSFNGIWVPSAGQLDDTNIPLEHGRGGKNVQYFGSAVSTRYGHSSVFTPGDIVTTMTNWLFEYGTPATPRNYLAWFASGTGVRTADLSSPTASTVIAQASAADANFMAFGTRLYCAFVDANGIGTAPGQVYGFGVGAEPLFSPPITTAPTITEPGGANTTKGAKLFGYLIQTKNGHITSPSPAPGSVFTPTAYTSLGGTMAVSIDPPSHVWPSYAAKVAVIMSTTANPAQFFIVPNPYSPGSAFQLVNPSAPTVLLVQVNDQYLAATGIDATPYLNQISQTVGGAAPIQPSAIFPYGSRVLYVTLDAAGIPVCYASDPSNPQSVNAATSAIYLPGQLGQTTGFALRGVVYLLGPHWTYSTSDSGGKPATWAQPALVDGAIGALGVQCVSLNASQNYAWVADQAGLYLFTGGSYPARPVSYFQSADWKRINFAAANAIQVTDDKSNQRVHVVVPLDGATSPTHILTWDYTIGTEPEQIQYSGACSLAGYSLGAIAMVQNNTSKRLEKWVGPGSALMDFGRENNGSEASPYRDFGMAIDSAYETAIMPRGMSGRMLMHQGALMRICGAGAAVVTAYGLDHKITQPAGAIALEQNPGKEILKRFFVNNEYCSIGIECNGLDSWFQLSRIDHYWTPGMPHR